jgi:hypothetical protein
LDTQGCRQHRPQPPQAESNLFHEPALVGKLAHIGLGQSAFDGLDGFVDRNRSVPVALLDRQLAVRATRTPRGSRRQAGEADALAPKAR